MNQSICITPKSFSPGEWIVPVRFEKLLLLWLSLTVFATAGAQVDSSVEQLRQIPLKYISAIDRKVGQYGHRVKSTTVSSLEKLSRWENKIRIRLEKMSPAVAAQLFGSGQQTFSMVLQRVQEGKRAMEDQVVMYDAYRDKLSTGLNYLSDQTAHLDEKLVKPLVVTSGKLDALSDQLDDTEALKVFIKERRMQLVNSCLQILGKHKYLTKISKESWYYAERIANYKTMFNEADKVEESVKRILHRIPAFREFIQQNSMLSSIFGGGANSGGVPSLAGLQTNAGMQQLIRERLVTGGPNAMGIVQQNIQQAQAELSRLTGKLLNTFPESSKGELPDFKPNMERSRTFRQRLEYGMNVQFGKSTALMPPTSIIAMSIGYRINARSIVGAGISYKLGLGKISHIRFSNEGMGLRTFIDWKIKREIFITGGYEINSNMGLKNMGIAADGNTWKVAALIGLTKKVNLKTKWFKGSNLQILYDFLNRQHWPESNPWILRMGYRL